MSSPEMRSSHEMSPLEPRVIIRRTVISTFKDDGNLFDHLQGELDMWIILHVILRLLTSANHNRQLPILGSNNRGRT